MILTLGMGGSRVDNDAHSCVISTVPFLSSEKHTGSIQGRLLCEEFQFLWDFKNSISHGVRLKHIPLVPAEESGSLS